MHPLMHPFFVYNRYSNFASSTFRSTRVCIINFLDADDADNADFLNYYTRKVIIYLRYPRHPRLKNEKKAF